MRETALKIARSMEKEGGGVLQGLDHKGSPTLGEDHADCDVVMQIVPLKPMKVHIRPDIQKSNAWQMPWGAGCCTLEGSCNLWRPTTESGSWWELWPVGKSPHRKKFSGKNDELVRVSQLSKGGRSVKVCGARSSRGELLMDWQQILFLNPLHCWGKRHYRNQEW